jgi:hypothetical protein
MERSVIVGVDGTGDSGNAPARAAELARAAGLTLGMLLQGQAVRAR